MSVKIAKDFMKKLTEDPALAKALKDAPNDEARRAIAKDAGFHFEKEHIDNAISHSKGEISDDELDAVAGGGGTTDWIAAGSGGAAAGVAVGGAAAAAA